MANPWNPPGPRFVGRGSEIKALLREVSSAATGGPRVIVVHGAVGMGKTRLLKELETQLLKRESSPYLVVRQSMGGYPDAGNFLEDFVHRVGLAVTAGIAQQHQSANQQETHSTRLRRRLSEGRKLLGTGDADALEKLANTIGPILPPPGSQIAAGLKLVALLLRQREAGRAAKKWSPSAVKDRLLEALSSYARWTIGTDATFVLALDQWDDLEGNPDLLQRFASITQGVVDELENTANVALIVGVRSEAISSTCAALHNRSSTTSIAVPKLTCNELESLIADPYLSDDRPEGSIFIAPAAVTFALEGVLGDAPVVDVVENMSSVWDQANSAGLRLVDIRTVSRMSQESRRDVVARKLRTFSDLVRQLEGPPDSKEAQQVMNAIAVVPDYSSISHSSILSFLPAANGLAEAVSAVLEVLSGRYGCQLLYQKTWDMEDLRLPGEPVYFFRHGLIQQDLQSSLGLDEQGLEMSRLLAAANALQRTGGRNISKTVSICASALDLTSSMDEIHMGMRGYLASTLGKCIVDCDVHSAPAGQVCRIAYALFALGEGSVSACANLLLHPAPVVREVAQDLAGVLPLPGLSEQRSQASLLLTAIAQDESACALLVNRLEASEPGVRAEAIRVLMACRPSELMPGLLRVLHDEDPTVRRTACASLAELGVAEAVIELRRCLEDGDIDVRTAAARGLGRIGSRDAEIQLLAALSGAEQTSRDAAIQGLALLKTPSALVGIKEALRGESPYTRKRAVGALAQIGTTDAIHAISEALDDLDVMVRKEAVSSFASLNNEIAVQGLVKATEDHDLGVRREAIAALGRTKTSKAVGGLRDVMRVSTADVRQEVVVALAAIGTPDALGGVLEALNDSSADVRKQSAAALARMEAREATQALLGALDDRSTAVRRQVVLSLAWKRSAAAMVGLEHALEDPDEEIRRAAVRSLGEMGARESVQALLRRARDDDADVRREIASSLAAIGTSDSVDGLLQLLDDADADVRAQAAVSLSDVGTARAVPRLAAKITDKVPRVRAEAAVALVNFGSSEALSALSGALQEIEEEPRMEVLQTLARLGTPDAVVGLLQLLSNQDKEDLPKAASLVAWNETAEALLSSARALEYKDEEIRRAAVSAIEGIGGPEAIPVLIGALSDPTPDVRRRAVAGLRSRTSDDESREALVLCLRDSDSGVRREAAAALAVQGNVQPVPELLEALGDADADVRREVALALSQSRSRDAVRGLVKALEDPSERVVAAAVEALRRLGPGSVVSLLQ